MFASATGSDRDSFVLVYSIVDVESLRALDEILHLIRKITSDETNSSCDCDCGQQIRFKGKGKESRIAPTARVFALMPLYLNLHIHAYMRCHKRTFSHFHFSTHKNLQFKKSICQARRTIAYDDAQDFAKKNGAEYIEASALTGENVNAIFELLVRSAWRLQNEKCGMQLCFMFFCVI